MSDTHLPVTSTARCLSIVLSAHKAKHVGMKILNFLLTFDDLKVSQSKIAHKKIVLGKQINVYTININYFIVVL